MQRFVLLNNALGFKLLRSTNPVFFSCDIVLSSSMKRLSWNIWLPKELLTLEVVCNISSEPSHYFPVLKRTAAVLQCNVCHFQSSPASLNQKRQVCRSSGWVNVSDRALSHQRPGIRSWLRLLCCSEGQWERLSERPEFCTLLEAFRKKQRDCSVLWGRFNYKWCFHPEPSWNSLFFRRSSSPNPQQGSLLPLEW